MMSQTAAQPLPSPKTHPRPSFLLPLSSLPALAPSNRDRLAFFLDWPFVSLSAHWLCGFSFMALAGLLATELRRVLHPDVMRGLLPQPGGGDGMLQVRCGSGTGPPH